MVILGTNHRQRIEGISASGMNFLVFVQLTLECGGLKAELGH